MAEPRQDCGSPARPLKAESPQRLLSAAESHLTQGRDSLLEATCIPPLIQVEFAAPPPPRLHQSGHSFEAMSAPELLVGLAD